MTRPFRRHHRSPDSRRPAAVDDQAAAEHLRALRPADWDGTTIEWGGASGAGLRDRDIYPHEPYPDPPPATAPLERARARGPEPDMFPALPPPPAAQDPRDTGPMQRMPRLSRVRQRPRPQRDQDVAFFDWSNLLRQHIMLCGTCPPERRSRYADPIAAKMPFPFESLRQSAYVSGWRLDMFGRWACPDCVRSPRYYSPAPVVHWHPLVERRQRAGDHVSPAAHMTAIAIREHDLIRDVHAAAGRYRHAGGAR